MNDVDLYIMRIRCKATSLVFSRKLCIPWIQWQTSEVKMNFLSLKFVSSDVLQTVDETRDFGLKRNIKMSWQTIQSTYSECNKKQSNSQSEEKKDLSCNNHITSITCYYSYFKFYGVFIFLLFLIRSTITRNFKPPSKTFLDHF